MKERGEEKRMRHVKKAAVLLAGIILCSMAACGNKSSDLQVEELKSEPEYLSFFAEKRLSDSNLGKYWSDRFVQSYNQQVYINYDEAAYYADEGLSYRELLEKRLESTLWNTKTIDTPGFVRTGEI